MRADEELTKELREKFGQRETTGSPEGRQLQVTCRALAQERLRKHKDKVKRVAKELLQHHEIKRARFKQLIQEG